MKIDTFTHKDKRNGWRSETRVKLGSDDTGRWQLDITTRKNSGGQLITVATVGKIERGCITHRLYTDYNRTVTKTDARCTEKNVDDQHAKALDMMDTIVADVRAHYARMNETITEDAPAPSQILTA